MNDSACSGSTPRLVLALVNFKWLFGLVMIFKLEVSFIRTPSCLLSEACLLGCHLTKPGIIGYFLVVYTGVSAFE